jgi:threonine-phosphate decarboxylase
MEAKPQFHGSDTAAVAAFYHVPVDEIVCFGANVNPLGLSKNLKKDLAAHLDLLSSYPDRNYTTLKKVIADYCQILPEHVIVGNGSTELISLLIQTRKPQKTLVLGPTYSEYGRELDLVGSSIHTYLLKESDQFHLDIHAFCEEIRKGYDLVILCNPNNPTSSALKISEIQTILDCCREAGSFLMIDETYVEFAPDINEISSMSLISSFDNLMILRGVSKFYAAPGLRLGYGATSNSQFLQDLLLMQNPWSLNSLGAYAGEKMLQDQEYIRKTRDLILSERDKMCTEISKINVLTVYPAYANFVLVKIEKEGVTSADVFEFLIKQCLMVRDCSSFKELGGEYFRFCIMAPEDNKRLLQGIQDFFA